MLLENQYDKYFKIYNKINFFYYKKYYKEITILNDNMLQLAIIVMLYLVATIITCNLSNINCLTNFFFFGTITIFVLLIIATTQYKDSLYIVFRIKYKISEKEIPTINFKFYHQD